MIALDENHKSEGSMLTIGDYNDDENIIQNCTESQNCVIDIFASGDIKNGNTFNLNLSVKGTQANTNFQNIVVDKLIVTGIKKENKYFSQTVDLSNAPFVINADGLQYNLNFTF